MITAIFTSCGRFDFLKTTIHSFLKYADIKPSKIIVIDNSTLPHAQTAIQNILSETEISSEVIVNEENIGQVASIDRAYSKVDTEYIFHCEDDWEFFDSGFMALSLSLLEEKPNIVNINLRVRFDGEKGSNHPISNLTASDRGVRFHYYMIGYLGVWHGFSWNPGLRRKIEYDLIGSFKKYGEESGAGSFYKDKGYVAVCLEKSYCRHIGTYSSTPKSNQ